MVATAFLLLSAVMGCFGADVRLQNDPQCKGRGQQCSSDLSQIIYCSDKGGNSYTIRNCLGEKKVCSKTDEDGFTCSAKVSDPPAQEPKSIPFVCHGSMMFPDPYLCRVAYACSSEDKYPDEVCECPEGTALVLYPYMHCASNVETLKDCSCPYKDRCDGKLNPGDFGFACQPGYFYTCKQDSKMGVTPDVYKCPDGQIFIEGKCSSGLKLVRTSAVAANVSPSCKRYEPPCLPEEGVKCSSKGQLIHHKVDRCYYSCDADLKPILRDCGSGSYFTCKYGPCGCALRKTN